MSDIKKDKELFDIPPGMRWPATKTPGQDEPKKSNIRSIAALIFFSTLLILAFVVLAYLFLFAWQHVTHNSDMFSTKKKHIDRITREKDREETRNRRKEMFALGKKGDPKGIPSVARTLRRSNDPDEREDAARALGEFNHHLVVEPLIDALDDEDKGVRERAIYSLSETHDLRALNALIEILSSKDYPSRASAANGLGHFKHPLAADALIEALSDEDEEVRRHAIFALGKIADPGIEGRLNRIRDETTDRRLKSDIMVVLNQIGDIDTPPSMYWKPSKLSPEDTDALIATLKSTEKKLLKNTLNYDRTVFLETVEVLGKTGDVRAEKALLKLLEKDYHPQTEKEIIKAVKNIGSPYSIPPLIKKLDDPNEMVAHDAYLYLCSITGYFSRGKIDWNEWWEQNEKGITKYNSDDMVASFITALDDPDLTVRTYAINFLGRTRDTRVVEPLIKQFYNEDYDKHTRRDIIEALAKIKDPRSINTLIVALDMDDGYSNFIIVRALGEFGDPVAVEPLIKALESSNEASDTRELLFALGKLGDPRATDAIVKKLKDPDPEICIEAVYALEHAGDMSAILHLKRALRNEKYEVREAVAKAILAIDGRYFYEKKSEEDQGEE